MLVTGALGGVGRTAVHVARQHGVRVLAGVRKSEKAKASELNADNVIAIDDEQEVSKLRDLDAIADTVGGTTIERLLPAIRSGGVLGSVLGKPAAADKFPIRVEAFMAQPDGPRLKQLAEDVARGEFQIPIARTMKLAEIQEAHSLPNMAAWGAKSSLCPDPRWNSEKPARSVSRSVRTKCHIASQSPSAISADSMNFAGDRMRDHLATLIDDFRRLDREIAVVRYQGNRRRVTTYGELARLAGRFAALLAARGIVAGRPRPDLGPRTAPNGSPPFTAACCAACWPFRSMHSGPLNLPRAWPRT